MRKDWQGRSPNMATDHSLMTKKGCIFHWRVLLVTTYWEVGQLTLRDPDEIQLRHVSFCHPPPPPILSFLWPLFFSKVMWISYQLEGVHPDSLPFELFFKCTSPVFWSWFACDYKCSLRCIPKQFLEKPAGRQVFSKGPSSSPFPQEHLHGTPGWSYGPESHHKRLEQ